MAWEIQKENFQTILQKTIQYFFLQISANRSCISEKWKLSSFELIFVLTHHSSFKKWTQNCLIFISCNMTPIFAELQKSYGMDFGKMVCKFHFWIPRVLLYYPSNFQACIITGSTKTGNRTENRIPVREFFFHESWGT